MKSLLISSVYFPPQVGGISQIMESLAKTLGQDRICCLTGVAGNGATPPEPSGPRIYRLPTVFGARAKPIRAAAWGTAIARIMVRERPQAVLLATADDGYLGLWLRKWLRLPYVSYAHGNEVLAAMRSRCSAPRIALQQADRVLADSHFTAELVQKAGVAPDRIMIVHPGCEVNRFRPLPPRTDMRRKLLGAQYGDRVILTVGNLVARKGHDMVIRALPLLRARVPDVTYLIVGDGPHREELETLAVTVGVRDRVIFAGRAAAEDLPDLYALSDVFVMPSRDQLEADDVEGFGIVFLEASACGKPVVGGRSGGISDAIVDGVTGFLVDPRDPEDIADTLARLLLDSDLAIRLGQHGRSRVVRDFDWRCVADRVQGILDAIRQ